MFTFGRDHEKACAREYVRDPSQIPMIEVLIDRVHDFLDAEATSQSVAQCIETCMTEGGAGVWEQTGSWWRKLIKESPEFIDVWRRLSVHSSAKVRFRAAAYLADAPLEQIRPIGELLLRDKSAKVRAKTAGEIGRIADGVMLQFLRVCKGEEPDALVLASLEYAIFEAEERLGQG